MSGVCLRLGGPFAVSAARDRRYPRHVTAGIRDGVSAAKSTGRARRVERFGEFSGSIDIIDVIVLLALVLLVVIVVVVLVLLVLVTSSSSSSVSPSPS